MPDLTLRQLLEDMVQRKASDLHITAGVPPELRIDGAITPTDYEVLSPEKCASLAYSVLSDEQRKRFETTRELDFSFGVKGLSRFRSNVFLQRGVVSMAVRQIPYEILRMESLGLPTVVREFTNRQKGLVLVTGPTGSGKTTTLYAAVNEIKTDEDKIITIEDPVEYQIRGITQIPVNEKKGLTFARGLRSILRHDPDKIMVGEIRDTETAQIAIQSALTGHLVFTTVHANNVVDVIGRFLNMGVEPYNFVSALNCILAQRLVRLICNSCRTQVSYPADVLEASGLDAAQWSEVPFFEGQGCIECAGTGFRGRTAIHELLDLSDRIREMILLKKPTSEIRRAARDEGMRFLRESALDKVRLGMTTLKEINKVTFIESMR